MTVVTTVPCILPIHAKKLPTNLSSPRHICINNYLISNRVIVSNLFLKQTYTKTPTRVAANIYRIGRRIDREKIQAIYF